MDINVYIYICKRDNCNFFADIDSADMDNNCYGHKPLWILMFMSITAKGITANYYHHLPFLLDPRKI
jgi:hypothetical protein